MKDDLRVRLRDVVRAAWRKRGAFADIGHAALHERIAQMRQAYPIPAGLDLEGAYEHGLLQWILGDPVPAEAEVVLAEVDRIEQEERARPLVAERASGVVPPPRSHAIDLAGSPEAFRSAVMKDLVPRHAEAYLPPAAYRRRFGRDDVLIQTRPVEGPNVVVELHFTGSHVAVATGADLSGELQRLNLSTLFGSRSSGSFRRADLVSLIRQYVTAGERIMGEVNGRTS